MKLSKTDFLIYRGCAHNAWVKRHRPDVFHAQPLSAFDLGLLEAGNEVDELARQLFPGGIVIERGDVVTTDQLIAGRERVLYQPVFETAQFTTACDILVWDNETECYDLYEVKASSTGATSKARDELYLYDLAFQAEVLRQNGVPLGRLGLVRLDTAYVRGDKLDIATLFSTDERTEAVAILSDTVLHEMDIAYELLSRQSPLPAPCNCMTKGRSAHCTTFAFTNPGVPDYSVHDIARIGSSKKKLSAMIDRGVLDVKDVPDDIELSDVQTNQVRAVKTDRIAIDAEAIAEFLNELTFPLIFLDYETYPAAVPRFPGYGPFDQIPFQYSLDVIDARGSSMQHFEFLHTDACCSDASLIAALRRAMPATGSVMTWNKAFEKGINGKLGERNHDACSFLADINDRIVDLMDVFSNQAYLHPGFRGRTSIKAILPVLVTELSYHDIAIQEGATATARWNDMVTGAMSDDEANQVAADLRKYCALDTLAMVQIWRVLCSVADAEHRVA